MSCGALTTGFDYECNDGVGGVKPGSILITQWDGITASTVANGELTAITAGTWYRYQVRKKIGRETTNSTNDPMGGTVNHVSDFAYELFNMSNYKNVQLQLLMSKPVAVIYQDNNDIYHIIGLNYGAEVLTLLKQSGKEHTEMNGYTINIQAEDKDLPYTVLASVVTASITISGALS